MLSESDLGKISKMVAKAVGKRLSPTNKKIDKVQKTLDAAIRVFNKDITQLKRRASRVETFLSLPPLE